MIVTVVNLAIGSYVWLHSSGVNLPQRLGMVSVNVMLALIFGLDKELWGHKAAAIGDRIITPILQKVGIAEKGEPLSERAEIIKNYLGSNVLYNLVNIPSTIILSWDHLFSLFAYADRARGGAISTFSGLGYGETNRSVSEAELPYAKLVAQGYIDLPSNSGERICKTHGYSSPADLRNADTLRFGGRRHCWTGSVRLPTASHELDRPADHLGSR